MKLMIVSDAWDPQINGVVRTLKMTTRMLRQQGHSVDLLTPLEFRTLRCPTYPEIRLAIGAGKRVAQRIRDCAPDALHIATEGPLGLAARRHALRHRMPFTTAYHTRFPEYLQAQMRVPPSWTYAWLRWFHRPSQAVMAPTPSIVAALAAQRIGKPVLWTRGVDTELFAPQPQLRVPEATPIFLYVGRVAVEKNLEAFLELDLPGEKWLVGDGPALPALRARYPQAHFFGAKEAKELPAFYSAADVFVFPSKTDTFGLVLLEALACGLPVAAYPVPGPLDVIGASAAGVLDDDLRRACLRALEIPRDTARAHALACSWTAATQQFLRHLHPRVAPRG